MTSWHLHLFLLIPLLSACDQVVGCQFSDKTQTVVAHALEGLTNQRPLIGVASKSDHGTRPKLTFSIGFDGAPDRVSVLDIRTTAQRAIEKTCQMEAPPMEISFSFLPREDR